MVDSVSLVWVIDSIVCLYYVLCARRLVRVCIGRAFFFMAEAVGGIVYS